MSEGWRWTIFVCSECGNEECAAHNHRLRYCTANVHGDRPELADYPPLEPLEVVPLSRAEAAEAENERLREALEAAADDLGKAANQFASMRLSQQAGHYPDIENNPAIFEGKEQRARSALRPSEDPA